MKSRPFVGALDLTAGEPALEPLKARFELGEALTLSRDLRSQKLRLRTFHSPHLPPPGTRRP